MKPKPHGAIGSGRAGRPGGKIFRIGWICLVFMLYPATRSGAVETPFFRGERLVFELRWGIIPAGEAVLEVIPDETGGDPEGFRFVLTARTTPFIDRFYKVRNRMESHVDPDITRSLFFDKHQQEGRTHKVAQVRFDWQRNEACYFSQERCKRVIPIQPGTFDPLSAFYYVRSLSLDRQAAMARPVTDGKKCVMGRARVVRREVVTVPLGTFDTYLLAPELEHVGGVFKKSEGAELFIWVTADHRKIPVKLQSRVIIGSFVGELSAANGPIPAKWENGRNPSIHGAS